MGFVKKARAIGQVSLSALEDEWQRRATAAAIEAARGVIRMDGPIPPLTPIGRLSDTEWGWIVAAILFAWISARAEQAAAENLDTERTIRILLQAMPLIRKAMIARDMGEKGITRKSNAGTIARQTNAAAGKPLMTTDELNDEIKL
jgi:hypothetical protein